MNWEQCWAGVEFSAQGGRCEMLLQAAARQGLRIRGVRSLAEGFAAGCPARHYCRIAQLARRYRVRLRVRRRTGIYFALRGVFLRKGLWFGLAVFGLVIWQLQRLVWSIDCSGLTVGQTARVQQALRAVGLVPGAVITQPLLTEAEYAVLAANGEFSWASVNFEKGRVTVECAAAKPVPDIDSEEVSALFAKADGTVISVQPEDGTPMVVAGQQVTKGQMLIGIARAERDGSLNYRRAAGRVIAEVEWQGSAQVPLRQTVSVLNGQSCEWYQFSVAGHCLTMGMPEELPDDTAALLRTCHSQLSVFGLPLPVAVTEHTAFLRTERSIVCSESLAIAKARLSCEQQLLQQFPDAEICAWKQRVTLSDGVLSLSVTAKIRADLCRRQP